MDPQQRALLQLTWEALEDAGLPPSRLAGRPVGVFVGGTLSEYAHSIFGDPAAAESHFATGNAMAILANRISYAFDLRGPSITFDTACSSGLVALNEAVGALRAGRVEVAIVGGINLFVSPASFISFSQAGMLSPTGRCRAFSADADGYVRAEGGAVLVLKRLAAGESAPNGVRGVIAATGVNSDGRTNGISLPSVAGQEALLRSVYEQGDIDPNRLAFVEAHGTGTAVGDPVEARALGLVLGQRRRVPLAIGSLKTNIGHLEAVSGLAGVIKSLLALRHGVLPRSLHFTAPNPDIDFADFKLTVAAEPTPLGEVSEALAGVSSFGFGGTNAHAVVALPPKHAAQNQPASTSGRMLLLSAHSAPALTALAERYRPLFAGASEAKAARTIAAAAHRRDRLTHRLVVASSQPGDIDAALGAFVESGSHPLVARDAAAGTERAVAFVYSGNGAQWPGMGRAPYLRNPAFRARFDLVDKAFARLAGWSLRDAMFASDIETRLARTDVAQPLVFAIQCALTAALRERGLEPMAVFGHSVGEVVAAEAAGIFSLADATRIVHARSTHQMIVHGRGRMRAMAASREQVEQMLAGFPGVEIAAVNSPRSVTVAGDPAAIAAFAKAARRAAIATLDLHLEYPFHTALMDPIEGPLLRDLAKLEPGSGTIPFISAVDGARVPGQRLDAAYWWHNVRHPVHFDEAARVAAAHGARFFLEIGPRGVLTKHVLDVLSDEASPALAMAALERTEQVDVDPVGRAVALALARGAAVDLNRLAGPDPGGEVALPTYPWQQVRHRFAVTPEAVGCFPERAHPLAGLRSDGDTIDWHGFLDLSRRPELADHVVGDVPVFPGSGYIEMALATGRVALDLDEITVADVETLSTLGLSDAESQEVMTRISPRARTYEVWSRPRLSAATWTLHSRGRIVTGTKQPSRHLAPPAAAGVEVPSADLYALAARCGLHYGPAFALVERIVRHGDDLIDVTLRPTSAPSEFVLDPVRLDACSHGIILVFDELRAADRGVTYLPVRIEAAEVHRVGGVPHRAIIRILSRSVRAIIAEMLVFGADGEPVATIRGIRCQATPVRRVHSLDQVALVETLQPADAATADTEGVPVTPDVLVETARAIPVAGPDPEGPKLLDVLALVVACRIATALATGGVVDPLLLVSEGRLSADLFDWLRRLLANLEIAGLATRQDPPPGVPDGRRWRLVPDEELPDPQLIIRDLAARHPELAAHLPLAAEVAEIAAEAAARRVLSSETGRKLSAMALEFGELADPARRALSGWLRRVLRALPDLWPADRALRVLQVGFDDSSADFLDPFGPRAVLTVFEPDRRRFERGRSMLAAVENLHWADQLGSERFDLVISPAQMQRLPDSVSIAEFTARVAPGGLFVAVEPTPSLFEDLVSGLMAPDDRKAGLRGPAEFWQTVLADCGFPDARVVPLMAGEADSGVLLAVASPAAASGPRPAVPRVGLAPIRGAFAATLAEALERRGAVAWSATPEPAAAAVPIIHVVETGGALDDAAALACACLELREVVEGLGTQNATFWLVFRGALLAPDGRIDAIQAGVWAFARTLANERPQHAFRKIDIVPGLAADAAAARILDVIAAGTADTEFQLDATATRVVRVQDLRTARAGAGAPRSAAVALALRHGAGHRLAWQPAERRKPRADEIEIEIAATGLNFRDVMYALGLIPDDLLEGGFTGPTLGLECAGTVVAVGPKAVDGPGSDLSVGDRVVALAANAFASHVVVPASLAMRLPDSLSFEAAATIPVAFLTAYYALVHLARLAPGERVLVHGAAGAVGLAAVQIARAQGAEVIATAGSPAKRDLLRGLGIDHVLDSRSLRFVEKVLDISEGGVDIVLNSLADEAMERSIECLRPFGRFIELGKRDFAASTQISLRPFRRNLSYFGVDLDQVTAHRPELGRQLFTEVLEQFRAGTFTPLPYSVFDGNAVVEAFHLLQQSGHIGKIVVVPPRADALPAPAAKTTFSQDGTHLVTGGLGGFGLAAAEWLADQGARHLVLVGRKGAATAEAKAVVERLAARGVQVLAEACDVSDAAQLAKLFETISQTMPPLAGVIHSAMVLDDTIVDNLDEERFARVLGPKVTGAILLDRLTQDLQLDYFVVFSSVVTMIGNRGQGSYVAANAYLEGLARRRRVAGLPALAVGWGPILDVGVVARTERMRTDLKKIGGVRGFLAREALDLMARTLAETANDPRLAMVTIAPHDAAFSTDLLPILTSPTYRGLVTASTTAEEREHIDLRRLILESGQEKARDVVLATVVRELARVLLFREEDISPNRLLVELGLDSLMAVELSLKLEQVFDTRIALRGSAGDMTAVGLADEILTRVGSAHLDSESIADAGAVGKAPSPPASPPLVDTQPSVLPHAGASS